MKEIESKVQEKRGMTSSVKVDEEILPWVPDTSFSQNGDNKFLMSVDMYSHTHI
jgi:hypothetical protein